MSFLGRWRGQYVVRLIVVVAVARVVIRVARVVRVCSTVFAAFAAVIDKEFSIISNSGEK
jgi:hypothetical protein